MGVILREATSGKMVKSKIFFFFFLNSPHSSSCRNSKRICIFLTAFKINISYCTNVS